MGFPHSETQMQARLWPLGFHSAVSEPAMRFIRCWNYPTRKVSESQMRWDFPHSETNAGTLLVTRFS